LLQSAATDEVFYLPDVDQMWAFLKAQMRPGGDDVEAGDTFPDESEPGAPICTIS
jgi:hypothetical protein